MEKEILVLNEVSFAYQKKKVLHGISFALHELDYMAILGPNGGGKSTLLKLILGLLTPSDGSIHLMGLSPDKSRSQVGYLPQLLDVDLRFPISVLEVVMMSSLKTGCLTWFNGTSKKKALHALAQVGAEHLKSRPIGSLSGGERQRVLLARSLVHQPRLLILDEPTCSIDPETSLHFFEVLKHINQHTSILLVSHDIHGVSKYAKKTVYLNRHLQTTSPDSSCIAPEFLCCHEEKE